MNTLKRAQVAKRIGKSVATVRRLEGTVLHPTVDEDGTHVFDPAEVDALAARTAPTGRAQSASAGASKSVWLRAELARRAEVEAEEREHVARLAQQRAETEAFHRKLAERRDREQRALEEQALRAQAEARADLEAVRSDLSFEIASASPRDLRRLSSDPEFMRTLEDLFAEE